MKQNEKEAEKKFDIVILGAGGHAKVLIHTLRLLGHNVKALADENPSLHGKELCGIPIKGGDAWVLAQAKSTLLVNAIGSVQRPEARTKIFKKFKDAGFKFFSVIHPQSIVATAEGFGEGIQIMAGCILQPDVGLGDNVLINTGAIVDHDCKIGPHSHIAPGVRLSGGVQIGAATHIGTGAIITQNVRIGSGCLLAAGSVLLKDLPDGAFALGVPAKIQ